MKRRRSVAPAPVLLLDEIWASIWRDYLLVKLNTQWRALVEMARLNEVNVAPLSRQRGITMCHRESREEVIRQFHDIIPVGIVHRVTALMWHGATLYGLVGSFCYVSRTRPVRIFLQRDDYCFIDTALHDAVPPHLDDRCTRSNARNLAGSYDTMHLRDLPDEVLQLLATVD
jgi:hypothetical protein